MVGFDQQHQRTLVAAGRLGSAALFARVDVPLAGRWCQDPVSCGGVSSLHATPSVARAADGLIEGALHTVHHER